MHSGDFKGLSQEYPSFELLWFDIMTKTRQLMQELLDPIVDRLVHHKDYLGRLEDEQNKSNSRIQELNDTFFNTGSKL